MKLKLGFLCLTTSVLQAFQDCVDPRDCDLCERLVYIGLGDFAVIDDHSVSNCGHQLPLPNHDSSRVVYSNHLARAAALGILLDFSLN